MMGAASSISEDAAAAPRLEHIAIVVRDWQAAKQRYALLLGATAAAEEEVASEGVRVCFFNHVTPKIELITPLASNTKLLHYLDKHGEGVHHLAYAVTALEPKLEKLKQAGLQPTTPIRPGSRQSRICFMHPRDTHGVLWEWLDFNKV